MFYLCVVMEHHRRFPLTRSVHCDLDVILPEVDFHRFRHPVCFMTHVEIQVRLCHQDKNQTKSEEITSLTRKKPQIFRKMLLFLRYCLLILKLPQIKTCS